MKVTILAPGSLGNLVPYVALGEGLQAAGIEAVVATHPEFRSVVEQHGIRFAEIGAAGLFGEQAVKELQESGRNPIAWARRARAVLDEHWDELARDSLAACEDADAVIFNVLGHPAYHIAEHRGIPAIGALYVPVSRTRAFPHPLVAPGIASLGPVGNGLTYTVGEQMFWQLVRKPIQRWRRDALGLDPLPASGIMRIIERQRLPVLYGFSPAVVAPPADWGEHLTVTGYWFLDAPPGWAPPAELERFLADGPPPVYLGFGSSPVKDPSATYRLVRDAVRRAGARAIVAGEWAARASDGDDDVFVLPGFVPFDWLFARVGAVVHHGGCGTTHEGLRAGRPSLLLPSYPDQFFFARRVVALDAGPPPIRKDKLTVDTLADALRTALFDETIRRGAARVGELVREDRGVERAVARVEQLLSSAVRV